MVLDPDAISCIRPSHEFEPNDNAEAFQPLVNSSSQPVAPGPSMPPPGLWPLAPVAHGPSTCGPCGPWVQYLWPRAPLCLSPGCGPRPLYLWPQALYLWPQALYLWPQAPLPVALGPLASPLPVAPGPSTCGSGPSTCGSRPFGLSSAFGPRPLYLWLQGPLPVALGPLPVALGPLASPRPMAPGPSASPQ